MLAVWYITVPGGLSVRSSNTVVPSYRNDAEMVPWCHSLSMIWFLHCMAMSFRTKPQQTQRWILQLPLNGTSGFRGHCGLHLSDYYFIIHHVLHVEAALAFLYTYEFINIRSQRSQFSNHTSTGICTLQLVPRPRLTQPRPHVMPNLPEKRICSVCRLMQGECRSTCQNNGSAGIY